MHDSQFAIRVTAQSLFNMVEVRLYGVPRWTDWQSKLSEPQMYLLLTKIPMCIRGIGDVIVGVAAIVSRPLVLRFFEISLGLLGVFTVAVG